MTGAKACWAKAASIQLYLATSADFPYTQIHFWFGSRLCKTGPAPIACKMRDSNEVDNDYQNH
jgi:hypothetical protein